MDSDIGVKRSANPRQKANFLSIATFSFTLPLFLKGRKRDLDKEDLYETWNSHQTTKLAQNIENAWQEEKKTAALQNRTPSLAKTLIRTYALEILLFGLLTGFIEIAVKILQPLALGELINYYSSNRSTSVDEAYLYAGAIVACSFISIVFSHPAMLGVLHVGMKLRISCITLIYKKILNMTQTNLEEISVGKVINLVANDVNKFDQVVQFLNIVWIGPIQTVIVTYFIYREVGVAGILGIIAFMLFTLLQFVMGKLLADCRFKVATKTDERVRLVNEMISGIHVIKMYAWETPYKKLADLARRLEMKEIRKGSYVKGAFVALITFPAKFAIFTTIMLYLLLSGDTINARQAFMLSAYFNLIKSTMAILFPLAIFMVAEVTVSIKRIREFLLCACGEEPVKESDIKDAKSSLVLGISNVSTTWKDTPILRNINLNIKRGSLVAIVGQVGSGKSSMFQAILKEYPLSSGSITVNGKISYSSQQPWLFGGTVRQNILFNNSMDKQRYQTIVKKCALKPDFTIFPYADKTTVGEKGVTLSGGQKARINLARAIYSDSDIYLLDDPLSAVDSHVGKQLFEDCICNFLRGKTVLLITHQLQYLKNVDHIVVLENGTIKAEGTLGELQSAGVDFTVFEQKEEDTEDNQEWEVLKPRPSVQSYTSLSKRLSEQSITSIDQNLVPGKLEESKASGTVSRTVYLKYISGAKSPFLIFFSVFCLFAVQAVNSTTDYFIMFWTSLKQQKNEGHYENHGSFWDFSTRTFIIIYSSLIAITGVLVILRSYTFYETCLNASKMLYQNMFDCIIRAKLIFFNTNPSGRILNRFSTDTGLVDEQLPTSILLVFKLGFGLLAVMVMVSIVNPWMLISAAVTILIVYLIAGFYLKTSRDIKRIEGVARSPVYAHINETLQGLPTIRAFNAGSALEDQFHKHQDLHSSAWYSFISSSTAFGYWLDLIALIYIAVVTFSFILLGNDYFGGNVGLAISQAMVLTGLFQVTMREMAEVENLMTSIERIVDYTTIESEPAFESIPDRKPPESWPNFGAIEFRSVVLAYAPDGPPVLKNVTFNILPLQKIGVVGRTGAGKSSLIAALFRLADIEGLVIIDEIDTKRIGLHDLRSKISIIPQDPVLFSGTMRRNLDPFDEYTEDAMWRALEEVELKQVVNNLNGGLNAEIQEGGTNLSVGQRQLVCLARAIIRNNKILVLDEATANVDPQTDNLIQKTIRTKFSNCTVLTIAHRLNTVIDSDKILVIDSGKVVEFDHAHILLQNNDGPFYNMLHENSKEMVEILTEMAKTSYHKDTQPENFTKP